MKRRRQWKERERPSKREEREDALQRQEYEDRSPEKDHKRRNSWFTRHGTLYFVEMSSSSTVEVSE